MNTVSMSGYIWVYPWYTLKEVSMLNRRFSMTIFRLFVNGVMIIHTFERIDYINVYSTVLILCGR